MNKREDKYQVTLEITITRYVGGQRQGKRQWNVTQNSETQIDRLEDCIAYVANTAEKLSTQGKSGDAP